VRSSGSTRPLLDGALEFGVVLDQIPSVQERRYVAARKAEQDEENAQYQRAEALRQAERRNDRAEVERLAPQVAADRKTEIARRIANSPRPTRGVTIVRPA
jgi:hypothetical protein